MILNPFTFISSRVLDKIKHLQITESIDMTKSIFKGGGAFSDVFRYEHTSPNEPQKQVVAIKRLRFYMKEDIAMVRVGASRPQDNCYTVFLHMNTLIMNNLYIYLFHLYSCLKKK